MQHAADSSIQKQSIEPGGFPIVAIGASAGGLDAYKRFFAAMPVDSGMAFVLIQHLDPTHESRTADLLARYTAMQVAEVKDQMPVEINHVFVIPPNRSLSISGSVLHLRDPIVRRGMRMPIDYFFRSLAEDQHEKAICIILSGTGSDGTLGLRAIKEEGGVTMAQAPETAQYEGMPSSAIATGLVDYVRPIEEMPDILKQYVQHACIKAAGEPEPQTGTALDHLRSILAVLHTRTNYDLRCYKKGTLMRRIERRMGLNHIEEMADYASFLRAQPGEVTQLFKDLLIGVTGFFREPEAFKILEKEVISKLVRDKDMNAPVRVWVPACATGEEPYSIAMLLTEQLQVMRKNCDLQIFATDIDGEALDVARAGVYPEHIAANVSPERLQRFLKKVGETYQVQKQIRDPVVFALQNLIGDPPFCKLDLISCRNLLIYLEPTIQRKVIALFHFALNENGYLFLGNAETIGQQDDLFEPVSSKWRVYRRMAAPMARNAVDFPIFPVMGQPAEARAAVLPLLSDAARLGQLTQQILLENFVPAAVLINRKHQILYLRGPTDRYLKQPTGVLTDDLLIWAGEGLKTKLRAALYQVTKTDQVAEVRGTHVRREGILHRVKVTITPVKTPKEAEGLLLVTFADEPELSRTASGATADPDVALVRQLENELKETQEDLQSTIEEMESANEELKAANEEVMSMNEELQSTNEELESSKEELQSLNEELGTLNNQLQDKVEQLHATNDDLSNLFGSTEIATIFLDTKFRIKRFTPATTALFSLIPTDVGRPIRHIAGKSRDDDLLQDAQAVLDKLRPLEGEVRTVDNRFYLRRIHPYRTEDNRIDGVVITWLDITERKSTEDALFEEKERTRATLESIGDAVITTDPDGIIHYLNPVAEAVTGWTINEARGRYFDSVFHIIDEDMGERMPNPVVQCLKEGRTVALGDHTVLIRRDGQRHAIQDSAAPILSRTGQVLGSVVVFSDVTDSRRMAREISYQAKHDGLTGLVNRWEFEQRLRRALQSAKATGEEHALCYMDLDQFKVINDTCGHIAGDELLRQLAGVLQAHVRKLDTLGRLGGDEFGILMEQCSLIQARRLAKDLLLTVQAFRFVWEGNSFNLGVSIGLVPINEVSEDITSVMKAADSACYAAKDQGRNRIHLYQENDAALAIRHGQMQWAALIPQALEAGRFHLYFQPIVPLEHSADVGQHYELLLRMEDEYGHVVLPCDFLPAAERYNLSTKLDHWVTATAFDWLSLHPRHMERLFLCAINLSGHSLGDKEFLKFVIKLFDTVNIAPNKICFEITETAAIANLAHATRFIQALKERGCRFSLDDFGSGLASFAYLKTLPVDFVKIDGVFVRDMVDDPIDLAMVKSINDIAHAMGKQTIAESVENKEILEKLKLPEIGVDYSQGYAFGQPRPIEEML